MAEVDLTMMLQSRILIIFNLPRLDPRLHQMNDITITVFTVTSQCNANATYSACVSLLS